MQTPKSKTVMYLVWMTMGGNLPFPTDLVFQHFMQTDAPTEELAQLELFTFNGKRKQVIRQEHKKMKFTIDQRSSSDYKNYHVGFQGDKPNGNGLCWSGLCVSQCIEFSHGHVIGGLQGMSRTPWKLCRLYKTNKWDVTKFRN